jgi:NAD+ kinase
MQIVIFGKTIADKEVQYAQVLLDVLCKNQITTYIYAPFLAILKEKNIKFPCDVGIFHGYLDFKAYRFDFVITLGGDGTILQATSFIRETGVPVFGINLGRLGFLAIVDKKMIAESIQLLMNGMYRVEERTMLYLESNLPLFGETCFALNDCTLLKRDTSSMIIVHTFINGEFLNSYWADGVIIATPTGSTGYSLSCGGPIVFPDSSNFVITPVAPHNLNMRPIVISDESVISFEIEGRAENFLCTLDSRFETITSAHQLAVRKNNFPFKIIQFQDRSFLHTIREKLTWGIDPRN